MERAYFTIKPLTGAVLLICLIGLAGSLFIDSAGALEAEGVFEQPVFVPEAGVSEIAAVIPCKGMIDNTLYESIRRRSQQAIDMGATYLIYEIQTYGGLLQAGDDISKYLIQTAGKKAHTVAYVTTEAISAGAFVSVSCKDIIMLESTKIGDCAPINLAGALEGVEREKTESFIRAAFRSAGEANNYPIALLESMVTQQLEISKVKNLATGKFEFFQAEDLPDDPNRYDLKSKKVVVKSDELLTLTASEAVEYGIARAQVKDLDEALAFLADRDGIVFGVKPFVLETIWSEEMVRWVYSPAVMGVLVMLAMLGVYVEFNTPGVGLPGLVALICVVIIIGSKYLTGLANWLEVAIFSAGVVLLMIEILIIPGFGVAGIAGIICIFAGLFGMLVRNPPGEIPWPAAAPDWDLLMQGLMELSIGFVGFLVAAWLFARYLPESRFLSGLSLARAPQGGQMPVSMTGVSQTVSVGDLGKVITPLRPAGDAKFGDAVVDVITVGQFIEKGQEVEIVEIHGNKVVVTEIRGS